MPVTIGDALELPALGRRFAWKPGIADGATHAALDAKRAVEQKIAEGTYSFEYRACLCGSLDDRLLATRDRYGFYYPFVACKRCGLLRANPRMTQASYAQFYDKEYRTVYGEDDSQLGGYFESSLAQGISIYRCVTRWRSPLLLPKVVFEVGCNMGAMLVPWRDSGCDVGGVDFSYRRIEEGKRRTCIRNLYVGGIEQLINTGWKADLVILHHVLEHFLELDQALAQIRSLMNPGALIYIALPGTLSWIKQHCGGDIMNLLQNAHTYQFSLATLKYVMECAGFELVRGDEEIVALFRMSERRERAKEDVPAGEFDRVLRHLRRMELVYTPRRYLKSALELVGLKEFVKKAIQKANRTA